MMLELSFGPAVRHCGTVSVLSVIRLVFERKKYKTILQLCFLSSSLRVGVLCHNLHESVWPDWKPVNGNTLGDAYSLCNFSSSIGKTSVVLGGASEGWDAKRDR